MHEVRLVVGGYDFTGWEEMSFKRSIDSLSAQFTLKAVYSGDFPIKEMQSVQLYIDNDKILDGYIDALEETIDAETTRLRITGRDKAADLIDCSVDHSSQSFNEITFQELLDIVAVPFGVSVNYNVSGLETLKKFDIQEETGFEIIDRAARLLGVFVRSDENGDLLVESYGQSRCESSLVMGQNIKTYTHTSNYSGRYSEYTVRGQQNGDDDIYGEDAASVEGKASDLGVNRYRPLIIQAESGVSNTKAENRASWESSVRAARSHEFSVSLAGWRQNQDGDLWQINRLASLSFPDRGFLYDLLIKEVEFTLSNQSGFITNLKLARPDAYQKEVELKSEDFEII